MSAGGPSQAVRYWVIVGVTVALLAVAVALSVLYPSAQPAGAPAGASRAKLEQIVASFHIAG